MNAPRKRPPDTRPGDRHKRASTGIRWPDDVAAALKERAKQGKTSVRAVVLEAVRQFLGMPQE